MFRELQTRVETGLWADGRGERRLPAPLLRAARIAYRVGQELAQGDLSLRATGLVYTTLLALVPLLAVSFSVLKAFGVHQQLEPTLLSFLQPLGPRAAELATRIVHFVENVHVGVLGSVGLALLLYTVVSLLQKVEGSFNRVWRVRRPRTLARRFSDYLSVLLVGPLLVFLALGITASAASSTVVQRLLEFGPIGELWLAAGKVMPYVFVIGAFTFAYLFVPNTRVRLNAALVGGLVGGILWQLIGSFFAAFIAESGRYTAIYSGFAIVILFMVWLYLSWLILLLGAQVSFYFQHPDLARPLHNRRLPGSAARERAGLAVMARVVARYERGGERWTRQGLAVALHGPPGLVEDVLDLLEESGLLVEVEGDGGPGLLPARPPEQVGLDELIRVLRDGSGYCPPDAAAMVIGERLEGGLYASVEGMTLLDLVEAEEGPSNVEPIARDDGPG